MTDEITSTNVAITIEGGSPIEIRVALPPDAVRMIAHAAQSAIDAQYKTAYGAGVDDTTEELFDVLGQVDGATVATTLIANRMLAHELGECSRFRSCPHCD